MTYRIGDISHLTNGIASRGERRIMSQLNELDEECRAPFGRRLTIVAGAIFLGFMAIATHYYWYAFLEVRPRLPFQSDVWARQFLDNYIWDRSIPRSAQRKYLLSLIFGTMAGVALTAMVWMLALGLPTLLFVALSAYGIIHVFNRWRKYRALP
jgi:hypothetical protein